MQKFTKTEIRWICTAVRDTMNILEKEFACAGTSIYAKLMELEISNLKSIKEKLEKTLEENDKRICIE